MSDPVINLEHVRPRPSCIDRLPGLSPNVGTTLYPYIYVSSTLYENLRSDEPNPSSIALIAHEQEHFRRIQERGVFAWYARYVFSPTFRLAEELAAMKPQFELLQQNNIPGYLEHRAKVLSGPMYLWPTSYKTALKRLSAIWEAVSEQA